MRNGLQIKGQAMSYIQCHFGNSMVDADIYLLQICATQLEPSMVLPTIFERYRLNTSRNLYILVVHYYNLIYFFSFSYRFHVMEFLSLNPRIKSAFLEGEQEASMLESCLTFLASVMSIRTNIGSPSYYDC